MSSSATAPAVFAHIDYDITGSKGVPTLNHLDGYIEENLFIARIKPNSQLPTAEDVAKYQQALAMQALALHKQACEAGVTFDKSSSGVALSLIRTVKSSLSSGHASEGKHHINEHMASMSCYQFVSEAVTRTIQTLKLDQTCLFDVDTTATTTRSIEDTLKRKHSSQYTFLIKPRLDDTLVGKIDMSCSDLLRHIKPHITDTLHKSLLTFMTSEALLQLPGYDRAKLIMVCLKSILTKPSYANIRTIAKKQFAIFDEDLEHSIIPTNDTDLLQQCIHAADKHIKDASTRATMIAALKHSITFTPPTPPSAESNDEYKEQAAQARPRPRH